MNRIVGVDEVGRGCLAGPVVAAAVLIPETDYHWVDFSWVKEIKDSKKLSAKKRESLAKLVQKDCVWCIREETSWHIDEGNILKSTLSAMGKAVNELCRIKAPGMGIGWVDMILVDGNQKIPGITEPQTTIISGDNLFPQIAAASIIAKVYRDQQMKDMHELFPVYGWDRNKGYGTAEHREAIMTHGITPLHRVTFRGVTEYA